MEKIDLATWLEILRVMFWGLLFTSGLFSGTIAICLGVDFSKDIIRSRARRRNATQVQKDHIPAQFSVGIVKTDPNDDKTIEFFTNAKRVISSDYC